MTEYPRAKWQSRWKGEPGTWIPSTSDGKKTALFCCPLCGGIGSLADHDIAEDGTIDPSVECPAGECSFHEIPVRLKGWKG
jgi:hypothetical protein